MEPTGSEIVARFMQIVQERKSVEISQTNMDRLKQIHDDLSASHGTMADGLRAMADFMDEKAAPDTTDDPSGDAEPNGGDAPDKGGAAGDHGDAAEKATPSKKRAAPEPPESRLTPDEREQILFAGRMREEMIQEALKAGVRALGERFNPERYQAILARSSYDEIRAMRDDWEAQAKVALSPRGRWDDRTKSWTADPTGHGGRQTAANDPSDPVGLKATVAAKGARRVNTSLYRG